MVLRFLLLYTAPDDDDMVISFYIFLFFLSFTPFVFLGADPIPNVIKEGPWKRLLKSLFWYQKRIPPSYHHHGRTSFFHFNWIPTVETEMPIRGSRPSLRLKVLYILFFDFSPAVCVCVQQNKGKDGFLWASTTRKTWKRIARQFNAPICRAISTMYNSTRILYIHRRRIFRMCIFSIRRRRYFMTTDHVRNNPVNSFFLLAIGKNDENWHQLKSQYN